jgi:hypothetical protein
VNNRIVDTFTRDTASAVSRRTSLLTLGGGALAAMTGPAIAAAGKSGKNASRKNADKRCKRQKVQCLSAIAEYCASLEEPQLCEGFLSLSCEPLARCNAGEAIARLLSMMTS